MVPVLPIVSPFSTEQLERGHLKTCHSPAYNLSKASHLHFRKPKESPAWSGPPHLSNMAPHYLLPALPQPQGPSWEHPESLGISYCSSFLESSGHFSTNVTQERPHLFDCQLLPTSFLQSMSHNLQLHVYLLIIGLSTDCNLCKGREYIPMYT